MDIHGGGHKAQDNPAGSQDIIMQDLMSDIEFAPPEIIIDDAPRSRSPLLDPAITAGSGESFYPDPEGILTSLCDICGISINYCLHNISQELLNPPAQRFFTAHDFFDHPDWPQLPQDPSGIESDGLWAEQMHGSNQQSLNFASIQQLDVNATTGGGFLAVPQTNALRPPDKSR